MLRVASAEKKNCLIPNMTCRSWEEKLSKQHFLAAAFGAAVVGEANFRPFIIYNTGCIMGTPRATTTGWYMSYSFFCKPSLWVVISLFDNFIFCWNGKGAFHCSSSSFCTWLVHKGENWVLSHTLPSFSIELPIGNGGQRHFTWYPTVGGSCRTGLVSKRVKSRDV